jgi:hypothetical protein
MMARALSEIEKEIAAFLPVDGYWRPVDDLLAEALGADPKSQVIKLFHLATTSFPNMPPGKVGQRGCRDRLLQWR